MKKIILAIALCGMSLGCSSSRGPEPSWSLELPAEWKTKLFDGCIGYYGSNSRGILQISSAVKTTGDATDADILQWTKEGPGAGSPAAQISCGEFAGMRQEYQAEGFHHRQWFLRSGNLAVMCTYICDIQDRGKEDTEIDRILTTLKRRKPNEQVQPIAGKPGSG